VTPRQSLASQFAEVNQVDHDRDSDDHEEGEDEAPQDHFWDRESQNVPLGELIAREKHRSPGPGSSNKVSSSSSSSKKSPSAVGNQSSLGSSASQAPKKKSMPAQDWWNAAKQKGWQYAAGSGLAAWVYLRPGYTKKTAEFGVSMFNSLEEAMTWEKANASGAASAPMSSSSSTSAINYTSSPSCTNPTMDDAAALANRALLVGCEDLAAQLTALSSSIGKDIGSTTTSTTWASALSAVAAAEHEQKSLMDAFAPRTSRTKTMPKEAESDPKAGVATPKDAKGDKRDSLNMNASSKPAALVGKSAQTSKTTGKKVSPGSKSTPGREQSRQNERDSSGSIGSKRTHADIRKAKPGKVAKNAASPMNLQPTKLADRKEDDNESDSEHGNDNDNDDYYDNGEVGEGKKEGDENDDDDDEPDWVLEPGEVPDLFPDVGADLLMRPGPSSSQSALKHGKPSGAPLTGRVIGWQPSKTSHRGENGRDECASAGEGTWLVRFDACDWGDGKGLVEKKQLFEGNDAVGTMAMHFETAQPLSSKRTARSFIKNTSIGSAGPSSSASRSASRSGSTIVDHGDKRSEPKPESTLAGGQQTTTSSSLSSSSMPPRAKAGRLKPRVSSSPAIVPGNNAQEQQGRVGMPDNDRCFDHDDDDEDMNPAGEEETQETQRQMLEATQATQAEMPRHLLDISTQATQAQSPLGHRAQKNSLVSSPLPSSPQRTSVQLPMSPPREMASSSSKSNGHVEASHQSSNGEKGGGSDGSAPIEQVVNALFASPAASHGVSKAPTNKREDGAAVTNPSLKSTSFSNAPAEVPVAAAAPEAPSPRVSPRKRQVDQHPTAVEASPNPMLMKEDKSGKKLKVSPSSSAPAGQEPNKQVPVITPVVKSPMSSDVAFAPKWTDSMLDGDFASVLWPALRRMGWFQADELYGRPQANVASAAAHSKALKLIGATPGNETTTLVLEARNAAGRDGFFATEVEVKII